MDVLLDVLGERGIFKEAIAKNEENKDNLD
jgi:hypothetical protein